MSYKEGRDSGKITRFMGTLNHYRYISSYEEAEQLYNSIKPLSGHFAYLDIRPLTGRGRRDLRIVKRPDEYILTSDWGTLSRQLYPRPQTASIPDEWAKRAERQISHTSDGVVTIYYPAVASNTHLNLPQFSIGAFCFMDRFMPRGMSLVRHDNKVYVQLEPCGKKGFRQYLIPQTFDGLSFKRQGKDWKCLNPVAETKKSIDRKALHKWKATQMPAYVADLKGLYPFIEQEELDSIKLGHYGIPSIDDVIHHVNTSIWHSALIAKLIWKRGGGRIPTSPFHPHYRPRDPLPRYRPIGITEVEWPQVFVDKFAVYIGNCFKSETIPLGQVCINSRYSPAKGVVTLESSQN